MSAETPDSNQNPGEFDLPQDQLAFELELIDSYEHEFPHQAALMHEGLNDIKRFTGLNVPKYKVHPKDFEKAEEAGQLDELGYFDAGKYRSSLLMLHMPLIHSDEEIASMNEMERKLADQSSSGHYVIGEVPPETKSLLEGLYSLTGAKVMRDERAEGQTEGTVVRKGSYQGRDVYFVEQFEDESTFYEGKPYFNVRVVDEAGGERAIHELSQDEFNDFVRRSGLKPYEARNTIWDSGITRENYKDKANVLGEAENILKGAINKRSISRP